MKTQDFEQFVTDWWSTRRPDETTHDLHQKFIMTTGFGGETGEVQEVLEPSSVPEIKDFTTSLGARAGKVLERLKKEVRDGVIDRTKLGYELGDVLYYLTKISLTYGFTLEEIMLNNRLKLEHRRIYGKGEDPIWVAMSSSEPN